MEAWDETWVHAFYKLGAQTDRIKSFLGEGLSCAHQPPVISVNRTSNLITIVVKMDLLDVVKCRMRLIAIIRTELEEYDAADCLV